MCLNSVHCSACEVGVTRCEEVMANTICKLLFGPYDRGDQHDGQNLAARYLLKSIWPPTGFTQDITVLNQLMGSYNVLHGCF